VKLNKPIPENECSLLEKLRIDLKSYDSGDTKNLESKLAKNPEQVWPVILNLKSNFSETAKSLNWSEILAVLLNNAKSRLELKWILDLAL